PIDRVGVSISEAVARSLSLYLFPWALNSGISRNGGSRAVGVSRECRKHDAISLAAHIAKREVSPEEVPEPAIPRAEQVNPRPNATVHKQYEQACVGDHKPPAFVTPQIGSRLHTNDRERGDELRRSARVEAQERKHPCWKSACFTTVRPACRLSQPGRASHSMTANCRTSTGRHRRRW